jgi:hypothetical protein
MRAAVGLVTEAAVCDCRIVAALWRSQSASTRAGDFLPARVRLGRMANL